MKDTPDSNKQKKTGRTPRGTEMLADLRRRLDGFWYHPELARRANDIGKPKALHTAVTLTEVAQAHLETLPTGLETHPESTLRLIGTWTTRDGEITEIEGQGSTLPEDDRLLVVTMYTTMTTAETVVVDTHVAIFEIVSEP
jgi:hypothetical protein